MAYWRILLAILVLLWGAPALAQDGDAAGDEGSPPAAESEAGEGDAGDDAGAEEGAAQDDAAEGEEDAAGADDEAAEGEDAEAEAVPAEPNWTFQALDADGDGMLTSGEFGTGLFEVVTIDGGGLGPDQYESVVQTFGLDPQEHDFDTADVNEDGVVTADQEFIPSVSNFVLEEWDADGDSMLSAEEYRTNMFALMDADADGTVTAQEFEPFADWFDRGFEEVAGGGGGGITEDFFMEGEVAPGAEAEEEPAVPETPADDAEDAEDAGGAEDAAPGAEGDDAEGGEEDDGE